MNGWAKMSGVLAMGAGIVYIIAIVLALADGLSFGTDDMASFASNSKYTYITALAGVLAIVAGASAIRCGVVVKKSMISVLGILMAIVGGVIIVSGAKDGLTNITWHAMGVTLYASLFVLAFGIAFAAASVKKFELAIIAVLLAFCIDVVYVLDIINGMLVPFLGAVAFIFAGAFLFLVGRQIVVEEETVEEAEEILIVPLEPAKAPMPAPAPVEKPAPAPAEEAKPAAKKAEAKPAEKPAPAEEAKKAEPVAESKPAEEAKPAPAEEAKKAEPAPAADEKKPAEEAKPAPAPVEKAEPAESEDDKVLRQGYETAVAKVGEDKAAAMSDEEIVATVKFADEELYTKVSAITGIVIADESEDDKVLRQGYETAVANVGEDKAAAMSDEEIVATVKSADEELYTKVSAITGITAEAPAAAPAPVEAPVVEPAPVVAAAPAVAAVAVAAAAAEKKPAPTVKPAESEEDKVLRQGYETAVAKVGEDKAAAMSDEEIVATVKSADEELYTKVSAITGIVIADESEDDKILRQGYEAVVAAVGEDRANELTDYEIVAVISEVDPALYTKVSAITGIVVAAEVAEGIEVEEEDDGFELTLEPTTPAGFLRRACWNKGLRCRKDYGPYYIPVAFVRSKVAVYIDGPTPDNRNDETLRSQSWVVLHFAESKITNGAEEAQIVYDAVKENTRALKKAKAKKKKKR